MNEHRRQILQMLSEGKISADEAERLITAIEAPPAFTTLSDPASSGAGKPRPKYLRVVVDSEEDGGHEGPTKVNVRVPMQLLRAGVRLAGLIPAPALRRANVAMQEQGVPIDLTQIKPENLEELVEQLNDLTVDVDQKDANTKVKVRVFCE
jgi:SHOCT-like protein